MWALQSRINPLFSGNFGDLPHWGCDDPAPLRHTFHDPDLVSVAVRAIFAPIPPALNSADETTSVTKRHL
jgi:hypothetical protein